MANDYNTLNELFTAIADAIREKNNTTDTIIADDFPQAIKLIETVELSEESVISVLREILTKSRVETTDEDDMFTLIEKLDLYSRPFDVTAGPLGATGEDKLGSYTFVEQDYTPNPTVRNGYLRLRPNVREMANLQVFYGESYDLTEWTQAAHRKKNDGSCSTFTIANGASRVIFPEVMPNSINVDGSVNVTSIPNITSVPPVSVYLPKHTANNANNSNWITGTVASTVTENIVVAPKGMDAPIHLQRFTKMSADTIVAILENLADVNGSTAVNGSGKPVNYTLTLGADNLNKLTEEQKNIAYAKGWNLA